MSKRWRSREWLQFVRSLRCACGESDCPNCKPIGIPVRVVAAHLRTVHTGAGVKPDDFLAYPLSDTVHRRYHNSGQPTVARQLELVTLALRAGFENGVLRVEIDNHEPIFPW